MESFQEATSETVKRKSSLSHSLSGQVGTKQKKQFYCVENGQGDTVFFFGD